MNRCKTCKHWVLQEDGEPCAGDDIISPPDPDSYDREEGEEAIAARWGHNVRFCRHPKLLYYQRPDKNGMTVVDDEECFAALLTSEDFGCVLWENAIAQTIPTGENNAAE